MRMLFVRQTNEMRLGRRREKESSSQQLPTNCNSFYESKKRVESSCFQFLARSFLPMAQSRIHYLCTNCVHNQMLKSHQQSGIQWAMARKDTTCGTLSAFDHAFNLLKLQLKLEKISLFFCPVCTSPSFLFNIFDSRNVIFFFFYFLAFFNSNVFFFFIVYDSYSIYSIP